MIKVLIGNIFESKVNTIVNTVNCIGVMGKGIALEFKKRFPEMMVEYKELCNSKEVKPGVPYLYTDLLGRSIINFPTKNHWRSSSKLEDIVRGLDIFIDKYKDWGITSIAFPPLGCGNGGLDWKIVGAIMYQKLSKLDIDIEIYAPFGTSHKLLEEKFLSNQDVEDKNIKGIVRQKIKKEWVALLEVLDQLAKEPYAPYIGRTVFQKICFVITEYGIDTGFKFRQGSYGPFSDDVNESLTILANSNLFIEQEFGRMTQIVILPEYNSFRKKYADYLESIKHKIDKTVDLFCRIKDTTQAEEVATVLFSVRELKKEKAKVSELELFEYIIKWKKAWDTSEKRLAVAKAIRNLVMLKWMSVEFSSDLIEEDSFFA